MRLAKCIQKCFLRLFLITVGISGGLYAGDSLAADQKASAFVLCKNRKHVRTIKILPNAAHGSSLRASGCAVSYAKAGDDEIVGTNRSLETCKSILKSIQYNLETAKWSCRNVSTAVVTTSQESSGLPSSIQ